MLGGHDIGLERGYEMSNGDLIDLLFPIINTAHPIALHTSVVLGLWFIIGFCIEFTHRYRRWHRVVDVTTILLLAGVCWLLYQRSVRGQFSTDTVLQLLPYLLSFALGACIGYVQRAHGTNGASSSRGTRFAVHCGHDRA